MKIKILLPMVLAITTMFTSCGQKINTNAKLETKLDSVSYSLGVNIASSLQGSFLDEINYGAFFNGMTNSFEDGDLLITEEDAQKLIQSYFNALNLKRITDNLHEGQTFLANNKHREGVITTERGFQYEIIEEGTGQSPFAHDTVVVHYTGTLIDGTVFDSSVDKPEPFKTALNRVIPGWTIGLQLMKEGSIYKFYFPTELGYGTRVRLGGLIEPNMALIFEIELIEVIEGSEEANQIPPGMN